MLISTLVTDALYLTLYDRELQPAINGGVVSAALNVLNYIFDEWRDLIPYPVEYLFSDASELLNTVFVSVDNVSFLFPGSNVKQPLVSKDVNTFNTLNSPVGMKANPQIYYFDPLLQNINIFPFPAAPGYRFVVWGRAALGPLTLNASFPVNMPLFMASALMYELDYRLCGAKRIPIDERSKRNDDKRLELIGQLKSKRQISLIPQADNVFGRPNSNIPPFPLFYYVSGGGQ